MISVMDKTKIVNPLEIEPQAFANQSQQFWTLQFAGWFFYALVVFTAIHRPQLAQPHFDFSAQFLNLVFETCVGFCLSLLQWRFIRSIIHFPLRRMLMLSFSCAALLGLVFNIIKLISFKVIALQQEWHQGWNTLEFGGWLLFSLTTMFVWTAIFFIMLYNTKLQKEHAKRLIAQTSAKDAQLQMLRYQLNPHFMFNTMNAISTLIYKDENDKANEMLDKLCEFFRYSLDNKADIKTTLTKEISLLDLYLSIEKVRFGERLTVNMAISDRVLYCQVPSMLLQPLVENSIKYAVEPRKSGGAITISAQRIDHRLVIAIVDNGDGKYNSSNQGFGIGMSNTKARLDAMFHGDFTIDITANDCQGTTVTIDVPFEKKL